MIQPFLKIATCRKHASEFQGQGVCPVALSCLARVQRNLWSYITVTCSVCGFTDAFSFPSSCPHVCSCTGVPVLEHFRSYSLLLFHSAGRIPCHRKFTWLAVVTLLVSSNVRIGTLPHDLTPRPFVVFHIKCLSHPKIPHPVPWSPVVSWPPVVSCPGQMKPCSSCFSSWEPSAVPALHC